MLLDHLLTPEFVRFYLVLIHILGSTVAIGTIVFSYIEFLYLGYFSVVIIMLEHRVVQIALLILILSGVGIVYIDTGGITSLSQLLSYKKLTTKIIIVFILIINSFYICCSIIPKIKSLSGLSRRLKITFGASAGLSFASWFSALFMGKASILVPFLDLRGFLTIYLIFAAIGTIVGILMSLVVEYKVKP